MPEEGIINGYGKFRDEFLVISKHGVCFPIFPSLVGKVDDSFVFKVNKVVKFRGSEGSTKWKELKERFRNVMKFAPIGDLNFFP